MGERGRGLLHVERGGEFIVEAGCKPADAQAQRPHRADQRHVGGRAGRQRAGERHVQRRRTVAAAHVDAVLHHDGARRGEPGGDRCRHSESHTVAVGDDHRGAAGNCGESAGRVLVDRGRQRDGDVCQGLRGRNDGGAVIPRKAVEVEVEAPNLAGHTRTRQRQHARLAGSVGRRRRLRAGHDESRAAVDAAVGAADAERGAEGAATGIDDQERVAAAVHRREAARGVAVDNCRKRCGDAANARGGAQGRAVGHDNLADRVAQTDEPGFAGYQHGTSTEGDLAPARRAAVDGDAGRRRHGEGWERDRGVVGTRNEERLAVGKRGVARHCAVGDAQGQRCGDLRAGLESAGYAGHNMAVACLADLHRPDLAGNRQRAAERRHAGNACHGLDAGVARRVAGRRADETARERHDHERAGLEGRNEVGDRGERRRQRSAVAAERDRRQGRAAVDQDQAVGAEGTRGEERTRHRVKGLCQPGHHAGQIVAGAGHVARLHQRAVDGDLSAPHLARDRRRRREGRAHEVGVGIDVGGQAFGDRLDRLDHIGNADAAGGHRPGLAEARRSDKLDACGGRRDRGADHRAIDASADRRCRAERAGAGIDDGEHRAVGAGCESGKARVDPCGERGGNFGQGHGLAHHVDLAAGTNTGDEIDRDGLADLRGDGERHAAAGERRTADRPGGARDGEHRVAQQRDARAARGRLEGGGVDDLLRQRGDKLRERLVGANSVLEVGRTVDSDAPDVARDRRTLRRGVGAGRGRGGFGAGDDGARSREACNRNARRERLAGVRCGARNGEHSAVDLREVRCSRQRVDRDRKIEGQRRHVSGHRRRDAGVRTRHRQEHAPGVANEHWADQGDRARGRIDERRGGDRRRRDAKAGREAGAGLVDDDERGAVADGEEAVGAIRVDRGRQPRRCACQGGVASGVAVAGQAARADRRLDVDRPYVTHADAAGKRGARAACHCAADGEVAAADPLRQQCTGERRGSAGDDDARAAGGCAIAGEGTRRPVAGIDRLGQARRDALKREGRATVQVGRQHRIGRHPRQADLERPHLARRRRCRRCG